MLAAFCSMSFAIPTSSDQERRGDDEAERLKPHSSAEPTITASYEPAGMNTRQSNTRKFRAAEFIMTTMPRGKPGSGRRHVESIGAVRRSLNRADEGMIVRTSVLPFALV